MGETKIDISELKSEGSDVVNDLTAFLKEKTKAEIESGTNEITVKRADEKEASLSRIGLRLLLRKFLHKSELKEYYRVIGGKENSLLIRERKVREEE
jgi:hypothetical protein